MGEATEVERPGGWVPGIGWVAVLPLPDGTLFTRPGRDEHHHIYSDAWAQAAGQIVTVTRWPDNSEPAPGEAGRVSVGGPAPMWRLRCGYHSGDHTDQCWVPVEPPVAAVRADQQGADQRYSFATEAVLESPLLSAAHEAAFWSYVDGESDLDALRAALSGAAPSGADQQEPDGRWTAEVHGVGDTTEIRFRHNDRDGYWRFRGPTEADARSIAAQVNAAAAAPSTPGAPEAGEPHPWGEVALPGEDAWRSEDGALPPGAPEAGHEMRRAWVCVLFGPSTPYCSPENPCAGGGCHWVEWGPTEPGLTVGEFRAKYGLDLSVLDALGSLSEAASWAVWAWERNDPTLVARMVQLRDRLSGAAPPPAVQGAPGLPDALNALVEAHDAELEAMGSREHMGAMDDLCEAACAVVEAWRGCTPGAPSTDPAPEPGREVNDLVEGHE